MLTGRTVQGLDTTNGDKMTGRIPARAAVLCALAAAAVLAISAGPASAEVIYTNIPATLPGNFASIGNEAYSNAELGGQVEFAGAARKNPKLTVVMSSWACQNGSWFADNCVTAMGARYEMPITFSVYEVGPGGSVGNKIAGGSKVFKLPYRPSASAKCTGAQAGEWYGKGSCWHGKAFKISLMLKVASLPSKAIVSVSYDTTDHGPNPIGATACNSTSAGCYYDSLNVGLLEPAEGGATVGSDPTEAVYANSSYAEMCGGTGGSFAASACPTFWEGSQPLIEVNASS